MARKLYSPQEAVTRYGMLPPEVKSLLYSAEMLMIIRQIAQKHQLHIDQTGILEDETSAVMLGFIQTAEFPQILAETLSVDLPKAAAISQDVNDLLFNKIRDAMKKVYEMNKVEPKIVEVPEPQKPAPSTPPTPTPLASALPITPNPPAPVPAAPVTSIVSATILPSKPASPAAPTTSAVDNPAMHAADKMLSEPTVSKTPPAPTAEKSPSTNSAPPQANSGQVKSYTTDPYREPPLP